MSGAVVLAAGRGSRLDRLTDDRPKCLVEVGGRSILDWTLDALRRCQIEEITLIGGYRAEALPALGVRLLHNPRWASSNMVRSLMCAHEVLAAGETIVSYGDILYRAATVRALQQCPADIGISFDRQWRALWEARFARPLDDAETFRQHAGQLLSIGARANSLDDIDGQYMGLIKLTATGWATICAYLAALEEAQIDALDMTSLLSGLLGSGVSIATVGVDGGWFEIDDGDDHALACSVCNMAIGAHSHDWRSA